MQFYETATFEKLQRKKKPAKHFIAIHFDFIESLLPSILIKS